MGHQLVGIGNAIVDVLATVSDSHIKDQGLRKGVMSLIDKDTANALSEYSHDKIRSGGSAANTIALAAQLGVTSGFVGRVGNDAFGRQFVDDMTKEGVEFWHAESAEYEFTARSFVMVTDDAERTMATYLGVAGQLSKTDLPKDAIAEAGMLYLEGYLWDKGTTTDTLRRAIEIAKENKTQVAFSVSDPFCVERHQADFWELICSDLNLVFANEDEIIALTQEADFIGAQRKVQQLCRKRRSVTIVVTRGAKGAVVFHGDDEIVVPTESVANLVDTTGAGDAFAAGFLAGIAQQRSWSECASIGNEIAGQVVQILGARPESLAVTV